MESNSSKIIRSKKFFFSLQNYDGAKIVHILKPLRYAYILHDKDTNEDGTPKTPHTHIFLEFPNQRRPSAIAKALEVPENLIEILKASQSGALRYLVHLDDPKKHRYEDKEVKSDFEWQQLLGEDRQSEWLDMLKVRNGKMTASEFYQSHSETINNTNITAKISLFGRLYEMQEKAPMNTKQKERLKLIKSEIMKSLAEKLKPYDDILEASAITEIAYGVISKYLTKEVLLDENE